MGQIAVDNSGIKSGRTYSCRMSDILDLMDAPDRAVVVGRLADVRNSHNGCSDWLASYGHHISPGALRNHRLGKCQCGRDAA